MAALALSVVLTLAACQGADPTATPVGPGPAVATSSPTPTATPTEAQTSMQLVSPAFNDGDEIPRVYSCEGENTAIPLAWSGVPAATVELALVMDDPDAGSFDHWIVFAIPADAGGIGDGPLPAGAREGVNDFRRRGYGGPCPPSRHRYVITLYALSASIADRFLPTAPPTGAAIRDAARGITIAAAQLTGTFTPSR